MKPKIHTILIVCLLMFISCSSDDDGNGNGNGPNGPTAEELLVSHGLWSFLDFNLIQVIDIGPSTLTNQQLEDNLSNDFSGITILFNSDFTGTLTNPQEQSAFTWQLDSNDNLSITPTQGDPIHFDSLNVTQNSLMMNTQATFYDSAVDYDVSVYGAFVFD